MPSVQSFYQILSQLTVLLYLIMYLLMFSSAIVLRYKMPKQQRLFRIGKGNGLIWFIAGLGFCGALLAFILSFIPPSQISTGSNTVWFSVLIIGCIIVVGAPFIIYASRKPSWQDPEAAKKNFSRSPGKTTAAGCRNRTTGRNADCDGNRRRRFERRRDDRLGDGTITNRLKIKRLCKNSIRNN